MNILILIATVLVFSIAGIYYSRKKISLEGFVSAKNKFSTGLLTLTLVMTSMGSWILFSPAETSILAGIGALIGYAISSACALLIFIWIGKELRERLPLGHSLTEYIFLRYGKGMYSIVLLAAVFYMGIALTAELTGIGLAAKMVFDIPIIFTVAIIGLGTIVYTAIGGLKASIFTDKIQSYVILPLLGLIFIAVFFFGGMSFIDSAKTINPEVFNLSNGIGYSISLFIAIVGAELFNNANWQRVYAAKSQKVMKKAFLFSGLIVIPIILITGLFGIFAIGTNSSEVPSVAMFTFLLNMPEWLIITTMVLAIALIMSSMDSLLNGLVSLGVVDLIRLKPNFNKKDVLSFAKWMTVVLAGIAMLVALKEYSVLYLFLVADLICVAAVFPTFYGLFSAKHSGRVAVVSVLLGLIAGAVIFPNPEFTKGSLLWSFVTALFVPVVISIFGSLFEKKKFDFDMLKDKSLLR